MEVEANYVQLGKAQSESRKMSENSLLTKQLTKKWEEWPNTTATKTTNYKTARTATKTARSYGDSQQKSEKLTKQQILQRQPSKTARSFQDG